MLPLAWLLVGHDDPVLAQSLGAQPVLLNLYVGQAHAPNDGRVKRIAVGNGRVIQATALDDRQVLIIPEAAGQSTLHLWGRGGNEKLYVVNVVPADASRLHGEIQAMLGDMPGVNARIVGDKVVIEGGNVGEEQANRLAEVSRRYPQIVNLISKVGLERMIAMDVRMVEIKRDVLKNIGIKWNPTAQGPTFGLIGDAQRSQAFQPGGVAEGLSGFDVRRRVPPFSTVLSLASSVRR